MSSNTTQRKDDTGTWGTNDIKVLVHAPEPSFFSPGSRLSLPSVRGTPHLLLLFVFHFFLPGCILNPCNRLMHLIAIQINLCHTHTLLSSSINSMPTARSFQCLHLIYSRGSPSLACPLLVVSRRSSSPPFSSRTLPCVLSALSTFV